jgi:hypothetical protein
MQTIVHSNILGLLNKFFIHYHREPVDLEDLIRFFRFIQNHGQLRPGSPTDVKKDPYGCDLFVFEILFQNFFRFLRNMDH